MPKDDSDQELIEAVARELRRPVPIDPALTDRVMSRVKAGRTAPATRRLGWAGLALAAGIGIIALFVRRPHPLAPTPDAGVSFTLDAPSAQQVSLVGDFNNWDPAATPLARATTGKWEAVIPLTPGRYEFTFVVDGNRWVADPERPRAVGDDFGQPNSVITVVNPTRS